MGPGSLHGTCSSAFGVAEFVSVSGCPHLLGLKATWGSEGTLHVQGSDGVLFTMDDTDGRCCDLLGLGFQQEEERE